MMNEITGVSERLSYLIEYQTNGNKKKFAELIGYKPQVITNMVSGRKTKPSYDVLNAIITSFVDINANWLLTGEGSMIKGKEVPEVNGKPSQNGIPLLPLDAFAGLGDASIAGVDFETIEERYDVPLFEGLKIDFMLAVRGSSMYPKYSSGDVVACRIIDELLFVQWNKVYVIDTVTQGVIMKRIKQSENTENVICKSDNPSYDPFELPRSEIRNIALVVGVIRLE